MAGVTQCVSEEGLADAYRTDQQHMLLACQELHGEDGVEDDLSGPVEVFKATHLLEASLVTGNGSRARRRTGVGERLSSCEEHERR